jgi:hypothetical protein
MKRSILLIVALTMFFIYCPAQTKQDTLTLQQKQYQFQVEITESQRLEIALKEQKAKAFDAWAEYQKALTPFQKQVQVEQKEEKKSKDK